MEFVANALVTCLKEPLLYKDLLESDITLNTLGIALLAYGITLLGYWSCTLFRKPTQRAYENVRRKTLGKLWNARYRVSLFIAIVISNLVGFAPLIQRISHAGGLDAYLESAYQYRFGTLEEDPFQNMFVVLAGLIGNLDIALLGLAILFGLREGLKKKESLLLIVLSVFVLIRTLTTTFRASVLFGFIALVAIYHSERKLKWRKLAFIGFLVGILLITINYLHQILYYLMAGYEYEDFISALGLLVAPHSHLEGLSKILQTFDHSARPLEGRGMAETMFAFLPRFFWASKAPDNEYGTILIQNWAGLDDWYQIAITNIGELIAHFGYAGVLGMFFYGILFRYFDNFRQRTPVLRAGFYCILLPRLWPQVGMGLSAVSITGFNLLMYLGLAWVLKFVSQIRFGQAVASGPV